MMSTEGNMWTVQCILLIFCYLCPGADAFDGGDTAALIIGLFMGITGILACLGAYARKKGAQG